MKRCPFCAEDIQDAAIVCRYCNRELPGDLACPFCKASITKNTKFCPSCLVDVSSVTGVGTVSAPVRRTSWVTWLVLIFFGLMFVSWLVKETSSPQTSVAQRTSPNAAASVAPVVPAKPKADLVLLSSNGSPTAGGSFYVIEGQVKNVSGKSLENVEAVGTWYDKNRDFIKTDSALVDYNPILPGQISPFKTMTTGNPAMSRYSVEFKRLFGGTLVTEDQRKK